MQGGCKSVLTIEDLFVGGVIMMQEKWTLFLIFLRLGCTAFGGPVAHLAFFHETFVKRRARITEQQFSELVALGQFLPGPASSQVSMGIGYTLAGYSGLLIAFVGFTLPSALIMLVLAIGVLHYDAVLPEQIINGLKLVTMAVIAQAVWSMGRSFCKGIRATAIALIALLIALLFLTPWSSMVIIIVGAVLGAVWCRDQVVATDVRDRDSRPVARLFLLLFVLLLIIGPVLGAWYPDVLMIRLVDSFYRTGAMVFGGGHVVLPMLENEVVDRDWLSKDLFLAGYGLVQAMPGPLFTFAVYLGSAITVPALGLEAGIVGGLVALLAIFLPSLLLVAGCLPVWQAMGSKVAAQGVFIGINAAVVGLLAATLYQPVWTGTIKNSVDVVLFGVALVLLMKFKLAPWLLVLFAIGTGWLASVI